MHLRFEHARRGSALFAQITWRRRRRREGDKEGGGFRQKKEEKKKTRHLWICTLLSQRCQCCDCDTQKTMKIFTSEHRHPQIQLPRQDFFFSTPSTQVKMSLPGDGCVFSEGSRYWKLMNTLQPIGTAHSPRPCYNVKYVLQSMHMHTAITAMIMKMKIIVWSLEWRWSSDCCRTRSYHHYDTC